MRRADLSLGIVVLLVLIANALWLLCGPRWISPP
jgi:hypothetical protein